MNFEQMKTIGDKIRENVSKVIVGKEAMIDMILISLFCSGHVLLEDVPGTGKTMIAKALSKSIDCDFKRIQFTPDLLPTDLTGINFFNQKIGDFMFRPGPIFTNIVLADEINRATPRTQASMLECMEERQVTVDGDTKLLKAPFFVIATQNPIETQGTFPLPEAQLDRFFMRLKMGYPSLEEGRKILDRFQDSNALTGLKSVVCSENIVKVQEHITSIKVTSAVKDYIMKIIQATRVHDKIALGVSPRGSLAMMKAAQGYAMINEREFVTPDDVKVIAVPILSHRLVLKGHAISKGTMQAESVILDILSKVTVPREELQT